MKVLVHDGLGIWLAVRRLHQGGFVWPKSAKPMRLTHLQFEALVLGRPWESLQDGGVIHVV